jgi:hypothetical protein
MLSLSLGVLFYRQRVKVIEYNSAAGDLDRVRLRE